MNAIATALTTVVVYFGSIKEFHFHEFDAYACQCGTDHSNAPRLELRDNGRVVLKCVRTTSVQEVSYLPGDGAWHAYHARRVAARTAALIKKYGTKPTTPVEQAPQQLTFKGLPADAQQLALFA